MAESAEHLEAELETLSDAMSKHEEDIIKLETKLREVKAKQQAMVARQDTASSRLRVHRQVHDHRIDEALSRYEQMERRLDDKEAEIEATTLGRGKTISEEIADLEAESAIEAELEALKRDMSATDSEQRGS